MFSSFIVSWLFFMEHFKFSDIVSNFKTKARSPQNKIPPKKKWLMKIFYLFLEYYIKDKINFDISLWAFDKVNCVLHHCIWKWELSVFYYHEINFIIHLSHTWYILPSHHEVPRQNADSRKEHFIWALSIMVSKCVQLQTTKYSRNVTCQF